MPSTLAWIADSTHRDVVAKTLNAQRQAGQFCDVLLKIAGHTLPSHACVLAACSPVFRQLILADRPILPNLTNAPQEIELIMPGLTEVEIAVRHGDSGLQAMVDLLDYIYTGYITLKNDSVDLVVKLAEAFALEGLCSLIKSHLCDSSEPKERSGRSVAGSVPDEPRKLSRRKRPRGKVSPTSPPAKATNTGSLPRVSFEPEVRDSVVAGTSGVPDDQEDESCDAADVEVPDVGSTRVLRSGMAARVAQQIEPKVARTYKCVSCDFGTEHCAQMLAHLRQVEHADTECSLCGSVSLDRAAFLVHLSRHDDRRRPFFCRQCDYQCRSRANLAAHVAKHAVERPYKCDECGRGFKWTTSLKIHKLSHQTTMMHLCDQCGYSTAYRNNLRVHARKHNGGMFPCGQCSYQANNRSQLKRHELTHAKLKPFVCEVCGQRFAQTGSLREHSKLHDLDANLLRCELCPYKTLRSYRLKSHVERTHGCGWAPDAAAGGVAAVGVGPLLVNAGSDLSDVLLARSHLVME